MVDFNKKLKDYQGVKASGDIRDRLREAVKKIQPNVSLNPQPRPEPPPKAEEEVVPDLQDAIDNPLDRMKMQRLIAKRYELSKQASSLKKDGKAVAEKMKPILTQYGLTKVDYDDYRTNKFEVSRWDLDEKLLLAAGVQPAVIQACKVENKYTVVRVTVRDQEPNEDEFEF